MQTYNFSGLASNNASNGAAENQAAVETETKGTGPSEGDATQAQGQQTADNASAEDLKDIMGIQEKPGEPEAEPATGDKDEGETKEPGKKNPAWMDQLPDELKKDEAFTSFEKLGDLAKAYKELAAKGDGIPGKDAKPEELAAFYAKLGVPETADGYDLKGDNLDAFKKVAFESHLTQDQARSMLDAIAQAGNTAQAQQQENMRKQYADTDRELRSEYGSAYGAKMQALKKGLTTWGGDGIQQKLLNAGLGFDPAIVRMFVKLGELSQEADSSSKSGTGSQYKSIHEGGRFTFTGL